MSLKKVLLNEISKHSPCYLNWLHEVAERLSYNQVATEQCLLLLVREGKVVSNRNSKGRIYSYSTCDKSLSPIVGKMLKILADDKAKKADEKQNKLF